MSGRAAGLVLGVVVPCRDEAEVVERKLENLARATWPAAPRAHALVLVDDGSRDETAERARAALERLAPDFTERGVRARVVANTGRPGKPGAVAQGLTALGGSTDLVVLSDADVVVEPEALVALARAFAAEPALALASGAQRFVRSLAADGTARAADGGPLVDAGEPFDRWTARVRRLESRQGRLFSVHGQLVAWRAALDLAPSPGVAADDLDLMLQVRARSDGPRRVELVPEAVFLEEKTPPGERRRAQAVRRARAWFGLLAAWEGRLDASWQTRFYRRVPGAAPELALLGALAAPLAAGVAFGAPAALAAVALELALAATPAGRHVLSLCACIARARRAEAREPLPERWEMARR